MVLLHAYILRELLKMFALTLLAVTGLFTMGGFVYNVMTQEGVSARDIARFLPMFLPIVLTWTMPIAALFTATIVYGRFAADNEFTACRSAGINIHRLFLSALLLASCVSLFVTVCANFVIPSLWKQINHSARKNVGAIAAAKLRTDGFVKYEKGRHQYLLTAEDAQLLSDADLRDLRQRGFEIGAGLAYLSVKSPTLLEIDLATQAPVRFTSAVSGLCQFDSRGEGVQITAVVVQARDIQVGQHALRLDKQTIGPIEAPLVLPVKPSYADLYTLLMWAAQPWLYNDDKVGGKIDGFIAGLVEWRFNQQCVETLSTPSRRLELRDDVGGQYEITAESAELPAEGRPQLRTVHVVYHKPGQDKPTLYDAGRAELIARPAGTRDLLVELRLIGDAAHPVEERNPRAEDYSKPIPKPTLSLDGLLMPEALRAQAQTWTRDKVVLDSPGLPSLPQKLAEARVGLKRAAFDLQRKVTALIHWRFASGFSALVAVLMGAALGVIFRGARALAAFALAAVPFAVVLIVSMMGRQLAEHAGTELVGYAVIWFGLMGVALADLLILRLGVHR